MTDRLTYLATKISLITSTTPIKPTEHKVPPILIHTPNSGLMPKLKSIQIFKVHEILFILMGAIANLDELKLILKKELRQEILTEVLDIIRDEFYPPEEKIRTEFIKKVEAAERRVREGKFTQYTPEEFEKSFL